MASSSNYRQALSEFADYVERQQSLRAFPGHALSVASTDNGHGINNGLSESHAELDIIDTLNLSEKSGQVRLKDLLLDTGDDAEDTLQLLRDTLQNRLLEGHGETLFDLGQEDNGESMAFNKEQWDVALDRLRRAAGSLSTECRILMTRNVGGPEEAEPIITKERGASGKILIRRNPETIEDVIETRIAVVGNGMLYPRNENNQKSLLIILQSGCWQEHHARGPCERRPGRWTWKGPS